LNKSAGGGDGVRAKTLVNADDNSSCQLARTLLLIPADLFYAQSMVEVKIEIHNVTRDIGSPVGSHCKS